MRIPKIIFETQVFELKNASADELLQSINEYFIKAPAISNPGDKEFVIGQVDFNEHSFMVQPIITDWWIRTFKISVYGTVTDEQIKVVFQTSALSLVLQLIFYILFIYIFFSKKWDSIAWLTIPILIILLIFNYIRARKQYKKDREAHIDFLNKFINKPQV